ncbi:MAG: PspA/IM30 family protein [Candidatus Ornithomonoglobus sp.]
MAKKKTKTSHSDLYTGDEAADIIELNDAADEDTSSVNSHGGLFNIKEKIDTLVNGEEPIVIIGNKTGDEEVHEDAFGITLRERNVLAYIITACIAAAIIAGSFTLAIYLPGDSDLINSRAGDLLQSDEEYSSLLEKKESLEYEVNTLQAESDEKKTQVDNLNDYDNTMAGLDMKIKENRDEIIILKAEMSEKQAQLDGLNASISSKNGTQITLTPGVYTVGTNLQVGKYSVTGSGKFQVASSDGVSKVNEILGASPYTITLEQGDKVSIGSSTKFTPVD